jgi:hypothetical protein
MISDAKIRYNKYFITEIISQDVGASLWDQRNSFIFNNVELSIEFTIILSSNIIAPLIFIELSPVSKRACNPGKIFYEH